MIGGGPGGGDAVAEARARRPTSSPHSAAARSTGHSASRGLELRPADACAPRATRGRPRRRRRTCRIRPRASAASVPGSGAMCSSQRAAVSVRSGSMATTCAPRLLGLLHERPLVQVGGQQVGAPEDDQPGLDDRLRLEADGARRRCERSAAVAGRGADRGAQPRGAEVGEQARAHRPALHVAHRAGEVVRQDRLGAVRGRCVACRPAATRPSASSQVAAPEGARARALGADPDHGVGQPVGAVDGVEVVVDLAAERALGERVVAVAADADGPAVLAP